MPVLHVTLEGPHDVNGTVVYIQKEYIALNILRTVCDTKPYKEFSQYTPPNCYRVKKYRCRDELFNVYNVLTFAAIKKTNYLWYIGVAALIIGTVVVVASGGVLLAAGAGWIAAGVIDAGYTWAALGVGLGATVGGATVMKANPDEYERGQLLSTQGPLDEIIQVFPASDNEDMQRINCPPPAPGIGTTIREMLDWIVTPPGKEGDGK